MAGKSDTRSNEQDEIQKQKVYKKLADVPTNVKTEVQTSDDIVENSDDDDLEAETDDSSYIASTSDVEDLVPIQKKRRNSIMIDKSLSIVAKKRSMKGSNSKKSPPPAIPLFSLPALTLKIVPMPVVKRVSLSLKQKMDIIDRIKNGEGQNKVATHLKLNRSTVQSIWANREKFEQEAAQGHWNKKKCRRPNNAELDGLVLSWVEHMIAQGTPANGTQIREHAKILARGLGDEDFTASHGWLDHFKQRNKIILPKSRKHSRMLKEIKDKEARRDGVIAPMNEVNDNDLSDHWNADMFDGCDRDLSTTSFAITSPTDACQSPLPLTALKFKKAVGNRKASNDWLSRTWLHVSEGYEPENIFFADEIGLFFRTVPESYKAVKGLSCLNGELPYERFSVLFGTNALGTERLKLVLVGGVPYPSSFGQGWTQNDQEKLPTEYWFHPKGFVTPDIISSWLSRWNTQMETGGVPKKVLLIMSNSRVHQTVQSLCSSLNSVKIVLPSGLGSSVLRHLECEIGMELKRHYKKLMVNMLIRKREYELVSSNNETESISVLDACGLLHTAWIGLEQDMIAKTFKKSGLVKSHTEPYSLPNKKKTGERGIGKYLIQEARSAGMKFPKELTFQQFVDLDENLIAVDMSVGVPVSRNNPMEDDEPPCTNAPHVSSLLSSLDHLRNWAVANQTYDLSVLHDAISAVQSFCVKNLLFKSPQPSVFVHPSPLNRVSSQSQQLLNPNPQIPQQPLVQAHQQVSTDNGSTTANITNFFTTIDPKSININVPSSSAIALPQVHQQQNLTSVSNTASSNSTYGIAFPITSNSNDFGNSNQSSTEQPQHQIGYIIANGHTGNVSIQGLTTVAANLLQQQQQHQQLHHQGQHIQNQYFGHH